MSNYFDRQILEDGWRNVVAKIVVIGDTSNFSGNVVLDPATLFQTDPPSDRLAIEEIQYSVQDGWVVELFWDAPAPKRIVNLAGRGMFPVGPNYGGLTNNAIAPTGKITLSTLNWSGPTKVATIIIHCIKQWSGGTFGAQLFLGQENSFLLTQEDGSNILVT